MINKLVIKYKFIYCYNLPSFLPVVIKSLIIFTVFVTPFSLRSSCPSLSAFAQMPDRVINVEVTTVCPTITYTLLMAFTLFVHLEISVFLI